MNRTSYDEGNIRPIKISHEDFESSSFDAAKYARDKFISQPVSSVQELNNQLSKEKHKTSEDLQGNVYRNYPKFISASKEISTVESDMLELRNLLTEQNSIIKTLQQEFGDSASSNSTSSSTPGMNKSKSIGNEKLTDIVMEDIQTLLDLPEKIDVVIDERRFEQAISYFEQYSRIIENNAGAGLEVQISNNIKVEIDKRKQKLVQLLTIFLQNETAKTMSNYSGDTKRYIFLLSSIGLPDVARDIYLSARSNKIEKEIKKLKFEGDIVIYMSELARVVFSTINTTIDHFNICFSTYVNQLISGFIVWVIGEIEKFGAIFRNQVFNITINNPDDFVIIGRCLEIAKLHCTLLESKGLSLFVVLNDMFIPSLIETINTQYMRIEGSVTKQLKTDPWILNRQRFDPIQFSVNSSSSKATSSDSSSSGSITVQLTESGKQIYIASEMLVSNVSRILTWELVPSLVFALSNLFESYLQQLPDQFNNNSLSETQGLAIIANAHNIATELVPRLVRLIESRLSKSGKEFEKLMRKLQTHENRLLSLFCANRADVVLSKIIDWHEKKYGMETLTGGENSIPSKGFLDFFTFLSKLKPLITSAIGPRSVRAILTNIIESVAMKITDPKHWEIATIGEGGLQQFVLDMKFFTEASSDYIPESSVTKINDCIDNALLIYCKAQEIEESDMESILKPDEWVSKRVSSILGKYKL